jgi:glycerate dehydrogenase
VLGEEPPRNGNPLLDLTACNLVVTPHTAWVSESALATFSEQLIPQSRMFCLRTSPKQIDEGAQ